MPAIRYGIVVSMSMKLLGIMVLLCGGLPAKEPAKSWPGVEFTHVVAYCYDHTQDSRGISIVFKDRTLHRGIIQATTVRLEQARVETLRRLLTTESDDSGEEDCYDPHHAFVFYDRDWKPIAWIDVCFLCDAWSATPKGVAERIDLPKLEGFCREIGLPVFEDEKEYGKLFKQERPAAGKATEKLENHSEDRTSDPFSSDER